MSKWMRALLLTLMLAAVCLFCACGGEEGTETNTADGTEDTPAVTAAPTEASTEAPTEPETEAETESPYLIPDPTRVDISTFSPELCNVSFNRGSSAYPEQCEEGVKFIGRNESRDPSVVWNMSSMYEAAGYPASADGKTHVPFTPEEKKVLVFKIQAEWGGAFELYYATAGRRSAQQGCSITEIYGGDSEFFGERVWQYVIFEADEETRDWDTRFNDGFRLDYTNYLDKGDEFLLAEIAICADRAEAEAYIAEDKGEPEPIPPVEAGYYICLYEDRLHLPKDNVRGEAYSSLENAIRRCDQYKQFGYRVANEKGEIVYAPYSILQCNLLREGHFVTEYARENRFKYGDSCTNPPINHRPHRTSCDRLVDWILYRAGFTVDQPLVQGYVVSNLYDWCRRMGFERITDVDELKAGDIIFVNPGSDGGPRHTFMLASDSEGGTALRYDHGSDHRIMNPQPTTEPVSYSEARFLFAYRPVATPENNEFYDEYYAD